MTTQAAETHTGESEAQQKPEVRINMDRLQRNAAQAREGPVAILGGPGSGKSHTLGARVVALLQGGRKAVTITCLTFSSRSASHTRYQIAEMTGDRELNRHLFIGTFHQFASSFLRRAGAKRIGISPHYTIWDHEQAEDSIANLAAAAEIEITRSQIQRMLRWNGLNKARWRERKEPAEQEEWHRLADLYAREKQLQSTLDLDDLVPMTVKALEDNPDLRETWSAVRTRHLLIDEFQDITPVQYRMAELLTGKTRSITVATDPNQAIHAWRGADPRLFNQFRADHADLEIHLLRLNHRSSRTLAETAAQLARSPEMNGLTDSYQTPIRASGPAPELLLFRSGINEQNQKVLDLAAGLKEEGYQWEDVALIYRNKSATNGIDTHLLHRNIPYTRLGDTKLGSEGRLRDVLNLLSFLSNPLDSNAFHKSAVSEIRGRRPLSRELLRQIKESAEQRGNNLVETAEEFIPTARPGSYARMNLEQGVKAWKEMNLELHESGHNLPGLIYKANNVLERNSGGQQGGRIPYEITKLATQAERTKRSGKETNREYLSRFLESVKTGAYPDHRAEDNDDPYAHQQGITLSTIHSAKGMQWKAVFFLDASQHVIPGRVDREQNPAGYEEEQRVFYTASTRATERLYYCNASRSGSGFEAKPTEFLSPIEEILEVRNMD